MHKQKLPSSIPVSSSHQDLRKLEEGEESTKLKKSSSVAFFRRSITPTPEMVDDPTSITREYLQDIIAAGELKTLLFNINYQRFAKEFENKPKDYEKYKHPNLIEFWQATLLNLNYKKQGFLDLKFKHKSHTYNDSTEDSKWHAHPLDILLGVMCQETCLRCVAAEKNLISIVPLLNARKIEEVIECIIAAEDSRPSESLKEVINYLNHHLKNGKLHALLDTVPEEESIIEYIQIMGPHQPDCSEDQINLNSLHKIYLVIQKEIATVRKDHELALSDGTQQYGNFACCMYFLKLLQRKFIGILDDVELTLGEKMEVCELNFKEMEKVVIAAVDTNPCVGYLVAYSNLLLQTAVCEQLSKGYLEPDPSDSPFVQQSLYTTPRPVSPSDRRRDFARIASTSRTQGLDALILLQLTIPFCKHIMHNALNGDKVFQYNPSDLPNFSVAELEEGKMLESRLERDISNAPRSLLGARTYVDTKRQLIKKRLPEVYPFVLPASEESEAKSLPTLRM